MNEALWLGWDGDGERVELPPSALLRHVMALGSSGSGKTVFCKVLTEATALGGVPAICVDPQGDLCSLAAGTLSDDELEAKGVDPALAAAFRERVEVVIFTPGAPRGIPLRADPIDASLATLAGEQRIGALTRTAGVVVGLLGYDLDADDGAGLAAVFDSALGELPRPSLAALTEHLFAAQEDGFSTYRRFVDPKKIEQACRRLARLDVGARRVLFHEGLPIDADVLLGVDPRAPVADGKTRVAVVYLNTLHQPEDKELVVAALADRLYRWMLAHPSPDPQALFYMDEVAPFVPPVRKPACKDALVLLFKQARKYGLCCLMATQNPGDIDYRAMAQLGTWALGRLTTRQDLKKVEPTIRALAPDDADTIVARLPSLEPGELMLLSPDCFDAPVELRTRWLLTAHETWTDERIEAYTDPMRERFAGSEPAPDPDPDPDPNPDPDPDPNPDPDPDPDPIPAPDPTPAPLNAAILDVLNDRSTATVKQLAGLLDKSPSAIRRALGRLLAEDSIAELPQGRATAYWRPGSGFRPDLSMPDAVEVVVGNVDRDAAERIGQSTARRKVLGVVGPEERLDSVELQHRLLFALSFEESVPRPKLARLFGGAADERVGNVYVHPHNHGVVVLDNERGLRFDDRPMTRASELRDLDGVTERETRRPGELSFEDDDWARRASEDEVKARFAERFEATPGAIAPLFVPLWTLWFRDESGKRRREQIDAILGKPVRWLPPG